jgi:preprotein translocase subunit SecE
MSSMINFFKEAWGELKKVKWPTRDEVSRSTVVVFVTVIIFTLFVLVADKSISFILNKVLGV